MLLFFQMSRLNIASLERLANRVNSSVASLMAQEDTPDEPVAMGAAHHLTEEFVYL